MIQNDEFQQIQALDLSRIKTKLMHAESGEGWLAEKADAAEEEYKRFLYLLKMHPNADLAPSVEVDTFWHYHILDTAKYAADCEAVFGHFVHHDPHSGLTEADEPSRQRHFTAMQALYASTFGVQHHSEAAYSWRSDPTVPPIPGLIHRGAANHARALQAA